MALTRTIILLSMAVLSACAAPTAVMPGPQQNFAAFGEDEDRCRREGAAAIKPSSDSEAADAAAAHQYDYAYQHCMILRGEIRQMDSLYGNAAPNGLYTRDNQDSFGYPEAFYGIPYATPGYGYDGFSPW